MSDPAFHRGIPPLPPVDIDRLASLLHADLQKGRARLDQIQRKLLKFFQWERVPQPQERVDETVRRALKRLSEGTEMLSPETDFLQIARMVARDAAAAPPARRPLWAARPEVQQAPPPDESAVLPEVRTCLDALNAQDKEIVVRYFHTDKRTRMEGRRDLAARLKLTPGELRDRALELRERLEDHVRANLG